MRLIHIAISHNCLKVRRALELKGLEYDMLEIRPMDRRPVIEASGQSMVPVLEDGGKTIVDSTAILHHIEQRHPEPSLLPAGNGEVADCWLLEDWADQAFMALSRRLAYCELLQAGDAIARLWSPKAGWLKRKVMTAAARGALRKRFHLSEARNRLDETEARRVARVAMDRLRGRSYLFGDSITVADIALASMSAPLCAAPQPVRDDPAVVELVAWGENVLGPTFGRFYRDRRPR